MKPEFTNDGLDIQSFDEIFEELSDEYKSIYGNDIVIDQDSPDGQRIGIESTMMLDLQSFASHLYNSIDPDLASGNCLNKLLKIAGVYRQPASQSQWDLEVTVSNDITLPATYKVKDNVGQEWTIAAETAATVSGNPNTVSFKSTLYGAITGLVTYTIEQVTYEPDVTLIEPSGDAVLGVDEETDEEVRIRRNKSLLLPSFSTTGGLLSRILNIANVTDAQVYENKTSVYDATYDLNAHSLWIVVEGGNVNTIAEVIAKNHTAGSDMKGDEEDTYYEDVIRPDGVTIQIAHEIAYDRPDYIDFYVQMDVKRRTATSPSIDIDAIKSALLDASFKIGDQVVASELYEFVYNGGTNFSAYNLEVSDDDITYTDEILDAVPGSKYRLLLANIDITEIPL